MSTGSKHAHESTLYTIVFDDFGAVGKLSTSASQLIRFLFVFPFIVASAPGNSVPAKEFLPLDVVREIPRIRHRIEIHHVAQRTAAVAKAEVYEVDVIAVLLQGFDRLVQSGPREIF